MGIKKISGVNNLKSDELESWGEVPVAIESAPSLLAGLELEETDDVEAGVWESSPGKWRRQIKAKEVCYFLAGECSYTDEQGVTTEIKAGDLLCFPANSLGVWNIKTKCRKVYMTVD